MRERKDYLDILRMLASWPVIMAHFVSQFFYKLPVGGFEWCVFKSFILFVDMALPHFCMISGSLLLSRDIPAKKLITKYISRLAITYIFWSLLYALIFEHSNGVGTLIGSFVRGHSHMWYLYMMAGLYLVTPLLRKIASDRTLLRYYIIIGFIFAVAVPEFISVAGLFSESAGDYFSSAYRNLAVQTVSGFAIYYMLGYYLDCHFEKDIKLSHLVLTYAVFILVPWVLYIGYAIKTGTELMPVAEIFSIGRFVRSAAGFLIAKKVFSTYRTRGRNFWLKVSAYSFGAYLVHPLLISALNRFLGINSLSFNPFISATVLPSILFVFSYGISFAMSKVPGLKKVV